jgi:hypothetical protein
MQNKVPALPWGRDRVASPALRSLTMDTLIRIIIIAPFLAGMGLWTFNSYHLPAEADVPVQSPS